MRLGRKLRRRLGITLVAAMLVVMICPTEPSKAADGFVIDESGVLTQYNGAENAVVIPDTVTAIGDYAFQGTTITSVSIPGTVTSIGNYAFALCQTLGSVSIPQSVTSVGVHAFDGCTSLSSLEWQSGAGIPDNAFANCKSLSVVSFAQSLPSIGSEAFVNCESLGTIAIPPSTSAIAGNAFDGCNAMSAINVDPGNAFFKTHDGALYSSTGVALYRCPQGKTSIEVAGGTQTIETNAFYGCKLGTVDLPESVTTVNLNAFAGSDIQTLKLKAGVSSFGEQNGFQINSIEVPGTSPVAGELLNFYGEIVVTDYVPPEPEEPGETEKPDPEEPGETEKPEPEKPGETEKPEPEKPGETEKPEPEKPGDNNSGETGNNNNNNSNTGNNNAGNNNTGNNSSNNNGNSNGGNTQNPSGGNAQNPSGGGNTQNSSDGNTANIKSGIPYIQGKKQIQGWDAIVKEMASAKKGSSLNVKMNGITNIPKRVMEQMQKMELTVAFDMGSGVIWTIKGKDISSNGLKDINFGVKLGTSNVPKELQKEVAGDNWSTQMHLAHDGDFGFTATLTINLGSEKAGHDATLYYYNEEKKELEYANKARVASNGDVQFTFKHASDYVIVVEGIAASSSTIDDTPKTGPGLNPKYIFCIGVMLVGMYMILTSRKETYRTAL